MSTTPELVFNTFNFSYKTNNDFDGSSNYELFRANDIRVDFNFSSVENNLIDETFTMQGWVFNQAGIHDYNDGNYGISKNVSYIGAESFLSLELYSQGDGSTRPFMANNSLTYSFYPASWGSQWYYSDRWNLATHATFGFFKGSSVTKNQLVGVVSFPFANNPTTQTLSIGNIEENDDENGTPFSPKGINCILKGTKIITPIGETNIEDLKRGDVILNSNGEEKIIKKVYYQKVEVDISNSDRDKYKDKYSLKEGNLVVSGGHMVKVDGEYHLPITSDKFENIQTENSKNEYYHLELDEYDYFVANGVEVESLCNVQSQKDEYYKEKGLDFQDLIKSKK
jgi:hypothetical protein